MLTKKQRDVLLFVDKEIRRTGGVSPSMREIMDEFRFVATNQPRQILDRLQQRGFIRRIPRAYRSIEVLRVPMQPGAAA